MCVGCECNCQQLTGLECDHDEEYVVRDVEKTGQEMKSTAHRAGKCSRQFVNCDRVRRPCLLRGSTAAVILENVREVEHQRIVVRVNRSHLYTLENVKHDARETVVVDVDFLVVRNLSNFAK